MQLHPACSGSNGYSETSSKRVQQLPFSRRIRLIQLALDTGLHPHRRHKPTSHVNRLSQRQMAGLRRPKGHSRVRFLVISAARLSLTILFNHLLMMQYRYRSKPQRYDRHYGRTVDEQSDRASMHPVQYRRKHGPKLLLWISMCPRRTRGCTQTRPTSRGALHV